MNRNERIESLVALFGRVAADLPANDLDRIETLLRQQVHEATEAAADPARSPVAPSADLDGRGVGRTVPLVEGRARMRALSRAVAADEAASDATEEMRAIRVRFEPEVSGLGEGRPTDRIAGSWETDPSLRLRFGAGPVSLGAVVALFPDGEEARAWLVAPNEVLGGRRPIDGWSAGEGAKVMKMAAGLLDFA